METITSSSVAKRKKRRTRKCLDEIRQRSRRNVNGALLEQSALVNYENKSNDFNGIKPNICITSDRLTLAMFPKLIRSETITRPLLTEIRVDPVINIEKIIKDTKSTNTAPSSKTNKPSHSNDFNNFSQDNSISSTCEDFSPARHNMSNMSNRKDSDSGKDNNSASSFLLFSPGGQKDDSELFEVSPETLSTSSSSSQSNHINCGHQLYEDFMSEIPIYLRQNTPALVKDDVMKKTKSLLHEIHLESCRQESEENILKSMRKTLTQPVTESPVIDYRNRISRSRAEFERHSMYDKSDLYDNEQPIYDKSDQHNLHEKSDPRSMYESADPLSLYNKSDRHITYNKVSHHKLYDNKYETPDYTYYPHKLNQ